MRSDVVRTASAGAASIYHSASELDSAPYPLDEVTPSYPPEAGLQDGVVVLRLSIHESGKVDRVEVLSAQPAGLFEASAVVAFGQARFAPGRRFGLPAASSMTIEVSYTPINRGGAVSGQSGGVGLSR